MAVVHRTTTTLDAIPGYGAARPRLRPVPAPARRRVRVREPQLGLLIRRAVIAFIPACCITTAIYGRMRLLEASVQGSHLRTALNQELTKQQELHSEFLNSTRPEEIDQFARSAGLVRELTPPIFVGGHQKGR